IGVISAKDLPQFTEDILAEYIADKSKFATFRDYLDNGGKENILSLVDKYKDVPSFEDDKNYYYDWGSEELFSVANKGPAECSAGLFDMIDVDLKFINEGIKLLEEENEVSKINRILYDIIFSSSRMLLVTKGAEPKTTSETFTLFIDKFINEGLVNESYTPLVEAAKANAQSDFIGRKQEVLNLANTVLTLYSGMDDSLQFKNTTKIIDTNITIEVSENKEIKTKDFRGVACPMNFVKTKIELSALKSGDLLEIWLDDGQPIQNVPGSVRNEGHEITSVIQENDFWKVLIKKA
ncbi:MAG TPA: sulfurtransferase TusA family protein, partial [Paludibacter sp.]